jgi:two-component system, NarL family, invasion response regulator UvrY
LADVYLVDDHAILRDALVSLLEAKGHAVVGQSSDPHVALTELRQLMPDIVLVDLNLGEHSGFELLADLKRREMRVKTLVTTMSSRPSDVAEALRQGADGYVLKGSSGNELLEAIDAVLSGRRYFEGRVTELAVQGLTTPSDATALAALSARERQVVTMVVNGGTSAEIAESLHLSPKTVDSYRSRLMAKVGVKDVQGLVRFALRAGLIDADDL